MGVAERFRENATGIASTVVTGTWLAVMFLFPGQSWLAVMLFGYIVVVPVVSMLFDDEESESDTEKSTASRPNPEPEAEAENARDALETLRERYARGELTDEQFERKLDRLLETESLEDAAERARETEREPER